MGQCRLPVRGGRGARGRSRGLSGRAAPGRVGRSGAILRACPATPCCEGGRPCARRGKPHRDRCPCSETAGVGGAGRAGQLELGEPPLRRRARSLGAASVRVFRQSTCAMGHRRIDVLSSLDRDCRERREREPTPSSVRPYPSNTRHDLALSLEAATLPARLLPATTRCWSGGYLSTGPRSLRPGATRRWLTGRPGGGWCGLPADRPCRFGGNILEEVASPSSTTIQSTARSSCSRPTPYGHATPTAPDMVQAAEWIVAVVIAPGSHDRVSGMGWSRRDPVQVATLVKAGRLGSVDWRLSTGLRKPRRLHKRGVR